MTKRTWIIWLIGVGVLVVVVINRITQMVEIDLSAIDWLFLLKALLIVISGLILASLLLKAGITNVKSIERLIGISNIVVIIACTIYVSSQDYTNNFWWVTWVLTVILPIFIYKVMRYIASGTNAESSMLVSRKITSAYPLFDSLKDPCQYLLTLAGGKPGRWRLCSLKLWPGYVVINKKLEVPLPFRHTIFTFNLANIRWLGSVQPFSETESEVWFDLDIDGWWYTLRVRLKKSLVKQFVEQLEPGLPAVLQTNDYRRCPNVRCGPVAAAPVVAAESALLLAGEPLQLYLTPLYLVLLNETFVQQAIPLAEVKGLEVLAAANLPEQQIVRFGQGDKTLAFAVQDQDFVHTLKARL